MGQHKLNFEDLPPAASAFYRNVMAALQAANIEFLVGGGYAFYSYTSIARDTKDLDIFVLPANAIVALDMLSRSGYQTHNKYPHWLGKVYHDDYVVDIIYSSGNGLCRVDAEWFEHGKPAIVLGKSVNVIPVEEMIWQKAFIMERHRYDGSDVMHLLHYHSESIDWKRLLLRFGEHWQVLFSLLVLYRFTYPGDNTPKLSAVLQKLSCKLVDELNQINQPAHPSALCRGTLLSLLDYLPAVENWGFLDARLQPWGNMTPGEVAHWTNHFEK